jgi:hypothetical protein
LTLAGQLATCCIVVSSSAINTFFSIALGSQILLRLSL